MAQRPTSLGDMFRQTVARHPDKVSHMVPAKGGHVSHTYAQVWDKIFRAAQALHATGLKRGDRVVILGESGLDWAVTDWAAQTLGLVVVPIYPTLPPEQAQVILEDAGATLAVCHDSAQASKISGVQTVLFGEGHGTLDELADRSTLTQDEWNASIDATDIDDLATLIYTSGTTGTPKGAMLTHRCFIALNEGVSTTTDINGNDVFLSFLPLSHVYERYAGHILAAGVGATVAYAGSLASLASDMVKVKPTIMLCVPRFLENVRARIVDSVRKEGGLKEKLFDMALSQGLKKQRGQFAPLYGVLDKLVGAKIRERTGGRIRYFISGGAALPPHVSEFYIAFGLTVLQGYGLTETTAASALNRPEENDPETVGPPIDGVEMMIAPDGEILIRGESVMKGYYQLPDATREAIDGDGWFHTGDIGEFKGNKVKITDRKKDLLVLANGKNVAPQQVENKLKESDLIAEAVLFGDGLEYCRALIIPDFDRLKSVLAGHGVTEDNPDQMVEHAKTKELIKAEITQANKSLADFEKVRDHVILSRAFSVEEGELTPSLKVKRRVVKEKYSEQLQSMQRK